MQHSLRQNYPNPFNPSTAIRFLLPVESHVSLKVYDMLGREVGVLLDHDLMAEGEEEVEFNAAGLASGVYYCRLVAEPVLSEAEAGIPSRNSLL